MGMSTEYLAPNTLALTLTSDRRKFTLEWLGEECGVVLTCTSISLTNNILILPWAFLTLILDVAVL